MKKSIIAFIVSLIIFPLSIACAQEELVITTYYPSPFGSYNELTTNMFNLAPQATQPAGQEGRMYYDSNEHTVFYHNGTDWIGLGGREISLATYTKSGDFTLSGSDWDSVSGWGVSGSYGSLRDAFAMRVDINSFGRSLYEITWGGQVAIDANTGKYMQLKLQYHVPSGSWVTLDSSDQYEDEDGAKNGAFTTIDVEPRAVTLLLSHKTYFEFRIIARKNASNANAAANVKGNLTYVRINRIGSF